MLTTQTGQRECWYGLDGSLESVYTAQNAWSKECVPKSSLNLVEKKIWRK